MGRTSSARLHRIGIGTASLLLLIIVGEQLQNRHDRTHRGASATASSETLVTKSLPTVFEPGVAYSLPVSADDTAVFDLAFDKGSRYRMIVSSLGKGEQSYAVNLATSLLEPTTGPPCNVPQWRQELSTPAATDTLFVNTDVTPHVPLQAATVAKKRTFYIHFAEGELIDRRRYAEVYASLVKTSPRLQIYWDQQLPFNERFQQLVDEIASQFENDVMPEISRQLAPVYDTDGDGRFTILLTPWLDRLEGGKTSLRGMVRGTDFRDDVSVPFGHHCDMLYLNPLASSAVPWRDILLHEFTHAVCNSWRMRKSSTGRPLPVEDDWIQEGMAHTLEPLGANQQHRISTFLAAPHGYPLVIADYYRAGMWRNDGCRGATSLFHRWITGRYGNEFMRGMLMAPSHGIANIEAVCEYHFDELFRLWTIDLMSSATTRSWNVDQSRQFLELHGTSASFWELHAESESQTRIHISGEPGSQLQVTLIRL
ncbi:MAG: hypothetical protein O2955_11465 [Planctomycetota bacterium]|nr:hypothetical protein [Planctomycetota bacterium]MDA1213132.1 hypothetical protein [Planctomycetota bacterium]